MNKDVIYIDTEDDITAIIGKIKASKERIVALVPPKRIGVLQSAVNLRLLARMAETSHKHLVLITNNKALIALSAVAMIPIAKNLQSKPEITALEELEIDEGEDIIEGDQMPVGDIARTADKKSVDDISDNTIDSLDIDSDSPKLSKDLSKNMIKVPNFSKFRKKFFIGGLALILLIIFLIWANTAAPAAKVIITAKTSSAPISLALKLGGTAATDISKGTIQTVTKQIKKDVSVQFDATGQKDLGIKSSGTMEITRTSISNTELSVPVGTSFSNGNFVFYSTEAATLAATQVGENGFIQDSATVKVLAAQPGSDYDLSARAYTSGVAGISANGSAMTGGTTKIATVVTADDIQKANQALVDLSSDDVKQQLVNQFTNGEFVISDSFSIERAAAVSVPAVDTEATGKAKLTSQTTFTMTAISKSEMQIYINDSLNKQITDSKKQRVYDDGIDKVKLSGYFKTDQGSTINVATIGQIGPSIDQDSVKEQIKGKRYGEVQTLIEAIQGVNNVDIKFSYFWVNTVPNDLNKIDVEFQIQNE